MSLCAYRAPRAIGCGGTFSRLVVATQGITAGSGMATTELRILFLTMVDESYRIFADIGVSFSYYVDDVAIEVWGTLQFVSAYAPRATNFIVDFMESPLELGCPRPSQGSSLRTLVLPSRSLQATGKVRLSTSMLASSWGSGGLGVARDAPSATRSALQKPAVAYRGCTI